MSCNTNLLGNDKVNIPLPNRATISDAPPSIREIATAIARLKSGKSAGTDNIPAEIFKMDHSWSYL